MNWLREAFRIGWKKPESESDPQPAPVHQGGVSGFASEHPYLTTMLASQAMGDARDVLQSIAGAKRTASSSAADRCRSARTGRFKRC